MKRRNFVGHMHNQKREREARGEREQRKIRIWEWLVCKIQYSLTCLVNFQVREREKEGRRNKKIKVWSYGARSYDAVSIKPCDRFRWTYSHNCDEEKDLKFIEEKVRIILMIKPLPDLFYFLLLLVPPTRLFHINSSSPQRITLKVLFINSSRWKEYIIFWNKKCNTRSLIYHEVEQEKISKRQYPVVLFRLVVTCDVALHFDNADTNVQRSSMLEKQVHSH